jgi:thioredoxin reductase
MHDVIIVGAGPAGLSAALVLGRARRGVLVVDSGRPRNRFARELHGYLSRDGIAPLGLLALGRREIARYGVQWREGEVVRARASARGFFLTLRDGARLTCRKLVLATGVRDLLPQIDGLLPLYGTSVHHCPYCDGYEWRDRRLAALGKAGKAIGLALALRTWSRDVIALTNGPARISVEDRARLARSGIALETRRISRLEGSRGRLRRIVLRDGASIARDALFFSSGSEQASALAAQLGCTFKKDGGVRIDRRERTGVPGLFLVGDASKDVQFSIVAAAEGATAAVVINRELQDEETGSRAEQPQRAP